MQLTIFEFLSFVCTDRRLEFRLTRMCTVLKISACPYASFYGELEFLVFNEDLWKFRDKMFGLLNIFRTQYIGFLSTNE